MLTDGFNHVAILTNDMARLHAFYAEVFGATNRLVQGGAGEPFWMTVIDVGEGRELNVFQLQGNSEADRQVPMFGRGRIDHLALQAASFEAFQEIRSRLIATGASDGFVTDFGPVLSVFFRDPDGLECEVCVADPDAREGVFNPPGTPSHLFPLPDPPTDGAQRDDA
jgi:catechol 2,3-dioxygenase-like lactoylglutathione lyase family enzyme